MQVVKYNENGKVHRVFTEEWATNNVINFDKLPGIVGYLIAKIDKNELNYSLLNTDMLPYLIKSLVAQRKAMVEYIELLHNEIDKLKKADLL